MIVVLGVSLGLTLLFESGFALAWGLREPRELLLVVLVNCLTNPPVVLLHQIMVQFWGWPSFAVTAALECAAVLTEWLWYRACSDRLRCPFRFSLLANAFSYAAGCIINLWI